SPAASAAPRRTTRRGGEKAAAGWAPGGDRAAPAGGHWVRHTGRVAGNEQRSAGYAARTTRKAADEEPVAAIPRMSTLFLRTLREDPADAAVPSHKLPVRAGYARRGAPGSYSWLPLGLRVLRNVERVVREELAAIGG